MAGQDDLTLAAISVTPERWNKQANLEKIEKYAREAAAQGAQLVITPEGFPLAYEVMAGNTQDRTTLRGFLKKIEFMVMELILLLYWNPVLSPVVFLFLNL